MQTSNLIRLYEHGVIAGADLGFQAKGEGGRT
jgi:hypothetical protein